MWLPIDEGKVIPNEPDGEIRIVVIAGGIPCTITDKKSSLITCTEKEIEEIICKAFIKPGG